MKLIQKHIKIIKFPVLYISSQFGIHRVKNYVHLDFVNSYIILFFPSIFLSEKSLILLPYLQCNVWSYVPLQHSITHIYILEKTTHCVIDIKSSLISARRILIILLGNWHLHVRGFRPTYIVYGCSLRNKVILK